MKKLTKKDKSPTVLNSSLRAIIKNLKINQKYDIPYLAGYNKSGKTIYLDKDLPIFMPIKKNSSKVKIVKFLVLHEIVEKSLIDQLGHINYEFAHKIATITEEAAVQNDKINLLEYRQFMQKYVHKAREKKIHQLPPDLDLKPYLDDHDKVILKKIKKAQKEKL